MRPGVTDVNDPNSGFSYIVQTLTLSSGPFDESPLVCVFTMTTTLECMQLEEQHKREGAMRKNWAKTNCSETLVYNPSSEKAVRLSALKEQVADLCDLQPTPASMVRPQRKVRAAVPPPRAHA